MSAITARFARLPLNQDAIDGIEIVTHNFVVFAGSLETMLPEGRSKALALTKLQEAKFYANDAIAHDPSAVKEASA